MSVKFDIYYAYGQGRNKKKERRLLNIVRRYGGRRDDWDTGGPGSYICLLCEFETWEAAENAFEELYAMRAKETIHLEGPGEYG